MKNVKLFELTVKEVEIKCKGFTVGMFDQYFEIDGVGYCIGFNGYGHFVLRRQDGMYLSSMGWETADVYKDLDSKHQAGQFTFKVPTRWDTDNIELYKEIYKQDLYNLISFYA